VPHYDREATLCSSRDPSVAAAFLGLLRAHTAPMCVGHNTQAFTEPVRALYRLVQPRSLSLPWCVRGDERSAVRHFGSNFLTGFERCVSVRPSPLSPSPDPLLPPSSLWLFQPERWRTLADARLPPRVRGITKVCVPTSVDPTVSHRARQGPPALTLTGATSWPKYWHNIKLSWGRQLFIGEIGELFSRW